jgi:Ca2+-binding EF-hand superfamily protein
VACRERVTQILTFLEIPIGKLPIFRKFSGMLNAYIYRERNQEGCIFMKFSWKRFFFFFPAVALASCAFYGILSFAQEQISSDAKDFIEDFLAARAAAFDMLDKDGKGYIEAKDWPGRRRAFRLMDVNRDGRITLEEFQSLRNRWRNRTFANLDIDGNRLITRDEWMDIPDDFDRLDRDKNGMIERHEFYNPR